MIAANLKILIFLFVLPFLALSTIIKIKKLNEYEFRQKAFKLSMPESELQQESKRMLQFTAITDTKESTFQKELAVL